MGSINEIFYNYIESLGLNQDIVYPNIDLIPNMDYYKVDCLMSNKMGLGISELDRQNGFCQVSCFVRDGTGEIKAISMANKIIEAFPRSTRITDGELIVRIDSPPYYKNGINQGNGWFMLPVTIPFTVLT